MQPKTIHVHEVVQEKSCCKATKLHVVMMTTSLVALQQELQLDNLNFLIERNEEAKNY